MSNKNIILKVENLSKQYRLGTVGTGTLRHDLNRWWHAIRGKEDPYLKIGAANDRTSKVGSEKKCIMKRCTLYYTEHQFVKLEML